MPDPVIRFAVGDPDGLSSNSWRVWVKPDGDVYIACRDNYRELKVSLHGARWRVGITDESAAATAHLRPEGSDRAWMRWDRPEPVGGMTMGFRILFLYSELALVPGHRQPKAWKSTEFVPTSNGADLTVATVTLNDTGVEMAVEDALEQHHGFLPLPDGGRVQLTLHAESLGSHFREELGRGYRQGRKLAEAAGAETPEGSRMFAVGQGGTDNSPFAAELNYHRPDPDPLGFAD